ncbi:uncharacterized protein GBIM_06821 [Gryllus bimaculatus]|nr:uncharacterized protein GBIM_06821 [Gryllus bimaculatus]
MYFCHVHSVLQNANCAFYLPSREYFLFPFALLVPLATSRIRYEITSGNIGGAFAVKNMTGAIYVAGALDYETRKREWTALQNKKGID